MLSACLLMPIDPLDHVCIQLVQIHSIFAFLVTQVVSANYLPGRLLRLLPIIVPLLQLLGDADLVRLEG